MSRFVRAATRIRSGEAPPEHFFPGRRVRWRGTNANGTVKAVLPAGILQIAMDDGRQIEVPGKWMVLSAARQPLSQVIAGQA
jgi:hypothetical protein